MIVPGIRKSLSKDMKSVKDSPNRDHAWAWSAVWKQKEQSHGEYAELGPGGPAPPNLQLDQPHPMEL